MQTDFLYNFTYNPHIGSYYEAMWFCWLEEAIYVFGKAYLNILWQNLFFKSYDNSCFLVLWQNIFFELCDNICFYPNTSSSSQRITRIRVTITYIRFSFYLQMLSYSICCGSVFLSVSLDYNSVFCMLCLLNYWFCYFCGSDINLIKLALHYPGELLIFQSNLSFSEGTPYLKK